MEALGFNPKFPQIPTLMSTTLSSSFNGGNTLASTLTIDSDVALTSLSSISLHSHSHNPSGALDFRFNAAAGAVSLLGNLVFMSIFVGQLGLHYLVGNIASIASCAILNFIINDRIVFLAIAEKAPASCK